MIILERFCDHPELGCFSELYINGEFIYYTVEQPWNDNKPFKSCVPVGDYDLIPFSSGRYGRTYALSNPELDVVVNMSEASKGQRYACLIHAANWASQLQGCIAPGRELLWGQRTDNTDTNYEPTLMVTDSRSALKGLLPRLDDERLLIRWKH